MIKTAARFLWRKIVPAEPGFHEWSECYPSWNVAINRAEGYSAPLLIDTILQAALRQKNGEAVYERDGVVFDEVQNNWPLLVCLQQVAMQTGGVVKVLDFGGALGSTYTAAKNFLPNSVSLQWNIVEQTKFVELGQQYFSNEHLRFYKQFDQALAAAQPNVILFSGVLQYLPNFSSLVEQACQSNIRHLIIDRTTFGVGTHHRIVVQNTPPNMYRASYPCWLFNEEQFLHLFENSHHLVAGFPSCYDPAINYTKEGISLYYKGFYFRKHD